MGLLFDDGYCFMGLSGVEPLTSRLSDGEGHGPDSGKFSDFKVIPHDLRGIQISRSEESTVVSGTAMDTTLACADGAHALSTDAYCR
jgi:hypothetical protein